MNLVDLSRRLLVSTFMTILVIVVQLYTLITLPLYYIIQRPWIIRSRLNKIRLRPIEPALINTDPNSSVPSLSPVYVRNDDVEYDLPILHHDTLIEMFGQLVPTYGADYRCIGKVSILIFYLDYFLKSL